MGVLTLAAAFFYTCEKIGTAYFAGSEDVREIDAGDRYLFQALQSIHKNKWDAAHGTIDPYRLGRDKELNTEHTLPENEQFLINKCLNWLINRA
jgi:hypothetical protein